ncbi:MAG: OmpA family protein [Flavobacteriaceae bacterium]
MRKILAFITLLLFLLLLWFSKKNYDACCNGNNNVIEKTQNTIVDTTVKKDGPLVYEWNSGDAITNDLWGARKSEILSAMADGKVLRILGPYFKEEGKEMGITRAKAAYAKLGTNLDSKRVEYGAKLVNYYDGAKTKRFGGTGFNWLTRNDNITEVDNKALIYFPTNSTKKLSNANIINYLKDVAKSLKGNTKKVALSGHTDSRGNDASNKRLALGRANSIKAELVRMGVEGNRVSTISFGEEKPIETNDTAAGRQKNRRVELEIK